VGDASSASPSRNLVIQPMLTLADDSCEKFQSLIVHQTARSVVLIKEIWLLQCTSAFENVPSSIQWIIPAPPYISQYRFLEFEDRGMQKIKVYNISNTWADFIEWLWLASAATNFQSGLLLIKLQGVHFSYLHACDVVRRSRERAAEKQ
jgi:hypothetical protein